jgi:hypothetical protein
VRKTEGMKPPGRPVPRQRVMLKCILKEQDGRKAWTELRWLQEKYKYQVAVNTVTELQVP